MRASICTCGKYEKKAESEKDTRVGISILVIPTQAAAVIVTVVAHYHHYYYSNVMKRKKKELKENRHNNNIVMNKISKYIYFPTD